MKAEGGSAPLIFGEPEHMLFDEHCWCEPEVETHGGGRLIVHHDLSQCVEIDAARLMGRAMHVSPKSKPAGVVQ